MKDKKQDHNFKGVIQKFKYNLLYIKPLAVLKCLWARRPALLLDLILKIITNDGQQTYNILILSALVFNINLMINSTKMYKKQQNSVNGLTVL